MRCFFCLAIVLCSLTGVLAQDTLYQGKTVKQWTELLKSMEPRTRLNAVAALQEAGAEAAPAVGALAKLLKDTYPNIRRGAAQTLAGLGEAAAPAAGPLGLALGDSDPGVRQLAGQALKEVGDKAMPALAEMLKDKEVSVRMLGLRAFEGLELTTPAAIDALCLVTIKDASAAVRRSAVMVLSKAGEAGKDAVPILREVLRDKDAGVRAAAASAILAIGKEHAGEFTKVFKDPNPAVRLNALQALVSVAEDLDAPAVAAMRSLIEDEDVKVRQTAVLGLAALGTKARELGGGKEVLTALTKLFQDKNATVRRAAVFALGKVGLDDKKEIILLAEGLKDKDTEVRGMTVQALAQYSHEEAPSEWRQFVMTHVAEALKDKDRRVQLAAAKALVDETTYAVPALLKLVETGQGSARVMAATVLGEIGADAADAVPALQKLSKEGPLEARQAAQLALKKIQP